MPRDLDWHSNTQRVKIEKLVQFNWIWDKTNRICNCWPIVPVGFLLTVQSTLRRLWWWFSVVQIKIDWLMKHILSNGESSSRFNSGKPPLNRLTQPWGPITAEKNKITSLIAATQFSAITHWTLTVTEIRSDTAIHHANMTSSTAGRFVSPDLKKKTKSLEPINWPILFHNNNHNDDVVTDAVWFKPRLHTLFLFNHITILKSVYSRVPAWSHTDILGRNIPKAQSQSLAKGPLQVLLHI